METSHSGGADLEVDGSSDSSPINLRKDLGLDLWFQAETSRPQSLLIRTTVPGEAPKSAFFHINGTVQQIPTFNHPDPLILEEKKTREFQWSQDVKKEKKSRNLFGYIVKGSAVAISLTLLAASLTGFIYLRVVLSGSMKPTINPGDLIIAASTSLVEPKIGDVVLYSARDLQGNAVTVWAHRIISGSLEKGFTIQGDANPQPDIGTIPITDIQSVVITHIPWIGHLFNIYSLILIFSGAFIFLMAAKARKR
jgi:signal peptidase